MVSVSVWSCVGWATGIATTTTATSDGNFQRLARRQMNLYGSRTDERRENRNRRKTQPNGSKVELSAQSFETHATLKHLKLNWTKSGSWPACPRSCWPKAAAAATPPSTSADLLRAWRQRRQSWSLLCVFFLGGFRFFFCYYKICLLWPESKR